MAFKKSFQTQNSLWNCQQNIANCLHILNSSQSLSEINNFLVQFGTCQKQVYIYQPQSFDVDFVYKNSNNLKQGKSRNTDLLSEVISFGFRQLNNRCCYCTAHLVCTQGLYYNRQSCNLYFCGGFEPNYIIEQKIRNNIYVTG